jgi:hypothetical protein
MENLIHMSKMACLGFVVYEDIIKENSHKMMKKRMEDMIHQDLESGRRITKAKRNEKKLIVALMSSKGSLRNAFLFYMDLVVARTKIKFSKELGAIQLI